MHPQLQAIADEFASAQDRLHRLVRAAPEAMWSVRPDPKRWSMAECVGHLNLTSVAFLPGVRAALASGQPASRSRQIRYRRDPLGWFMWRMVGPPARIRVRTPPKFVPTQGQSPGALVAEFDRLQAEQLSCVTQADGLDLSRLRVGSPFNPRASYNAYAALSILPRHQHRHLWQAEQVWATLRSRGSAPELGSSRTARST